MSHDESHAMTTREKIVHMANQIATSFENMPRDSAAAGVAGHINDFWDPRMRRQLFEILQEGGAGLKPLVIEAAPKIRDPAPVSSAS